MSMKTGLMAVMVASALASATLLGGCFGSGDVNNETTQPEENKTEQTQTTTPTTTTTTPATTTTTTPETKPETKPEPEPKKEPVKVDPTLADALGYAKVTSCDGMYVVAAFGDVTVPEAGSTDYTFTADGVTVDFDVSYCRVLNAEGVQIPYDGAETLPVGTLVELGGGGEGENLYVETIQLVNFTATDGPADSDTSAADDTTAATDEAAADTTADTAVAEASDAAATGEVTA